MSGASAERGPGSTGWRSPSRPDATPRGAIAFTKQPLLGDVFRQRHRRHADPGPRSGLLVADFVEKVVDDLWEQ